eukprot:CAMPEP_0117429090 /NCGR_PEP_ID=MMETSP0758-20121206/8665_1 /TAXON_ID=63605 /ORGANISM="Percolomonas cosmopolitus, Strain AE-1 (ATCC 50343)" /LENGTH=776 /DNA_ID=CAMNT_0005215833 /DNA_START=217 /DNA_END=2544 /DNA_ORIENTATION=+
MGGFVLMTSAGYLTSSPEVLKKYEGYIESWNTHAHIAKATNFTAFDKILTNKDDEVIGANPLSKLSKDVFDEDFEGVKWVRKTDNVFTNKTYPAVLNEESVDLTYKFNIASTFDIPDEDEIITIDYDFEEPLFEIIFITVCKSCDKMDYTQPITKCPNNECKDDRQQVCEQLGGTFESTTSSCRLVYYLSAMCIVVKTQPFDVLETSMAEYYASAHNIDNGLGCIPQNYSYVYQKGLNVFQTNWSVAYYKQMNLSDPEIRDELEDDDSPYPVNFTQVEIRDIRDPKLAEVWLTNIGNLDIDHSAFSPSITIPLIVLGAFMLGVAAAGTLALLFVLIIINKRWRVKRDREDAKRESAQGLKTQEMSEFSSTTSPTEGFSKRVARKQLKKEALKGFHHYREYYDPLQQVYELKIRHANVFFWYSLTMTSLAIFFSIMSKALDAIRVSEFKPGDSATSGLATASYVFAGIYIAFMVYYAVEVLVKLLIMRQKYFYLKPHQLPPEDEESVIAEKYQGIQWGNIFDLVICIVELLINYFGVFLPLMYDEINKVTLTNKSTINYAKNINSVLIHVGDGIIIRLLIFMLHYKSLWKIAQGMLRSVVNFVLSFLFLFVLVYASALAVTALYTAIECVDQDFCDQFNTPYKSTFYMFVLLTGDSWSDTANKAEAELIGSYIVISVYVCVGAFVLLNIVTGIVIDAILGNDDDQQHREVTSHLDHVLAHLTVLQERLEHVEKEIDPSVSSKPIFEKRVEPDDFISPAIDSPVPPKNPEHIEFVDDS